jgi:hypothetical protein
MTTPAANLPTPAAVGASANAATSASNPVANGPPTTNVAAPAFSQKRKACTKEDIRFSVSGNIGTGIILIRANAVSDDDRNRIIIDMEEPVELNFTLRYLTLFTKETPLSGSVIRSMSPDCFRRH